MEDCNEILKKDLVERAVKKGKNKTEANKMLKHELCKFLGIKILGEIKERKKRVKETVKILLRNRPCGPIVSKANPDAYTKPELVDLAVKKLNMTFSQANKLTKGVLCMELNKVISGKKKKVIEKEPKKLSKKEKEKEISDILEIMKKELKKPISPISKPITKDIDKTVLSQGSPSLVKIPKPKVTPIKKVDCIKRSKLSLKEHQELLVDYFNNTDRGLLAAWQVGSGKTLLAVTASQCYLDKNKRGKVIVITPTSLQENFKKEMKAYGAKVDDKRYEFLTLQKFANKYREEECKSNTLLIVDEAHNLRANLELAKDAESTRADATIKCAKKVDRVLLLTATIVYNYPTDVINLMAMVKKEKPYSLEKFDTLLNNQDLFYQYFIDTISFYKPKMDLEFYPLAKYHLVKIPMSEPYYREYFKIQETKRGFTETGEEKSLGKFLLAVRQASNMLKGCPKCDWVLNKVKEGEKTLIYSAFLEKGIERIQQMFKKKGIKFVEITGKLNIKQRKENVDDYNKDIVNVIFITRAGGEGLDLKGTRNVIIFESSWNRPSEEQVIGRAIRYKSHSHLPEKERRVDVYRLLMVKPDIKFEQDKERQSADEKLQDLMTFKENANIALLNILQTISIETSMLEEDKRKELFKKAWTDNINILRKGFNKYMDSVARFLRKKF